MEEINKKEDFDPKLRFLIGYRTSPKGLSDKSEKLIGIWCRGQTYPVSKTGQSGLQNWILWF
jgi:hypothetical protein